MEVLSVDNYMKSLLERVSGSLEQKDNKKSYYRSLYRITGRPESKKGVFYARHIIDLCKKQEYDLLSKLKEWKQSNDEKYATTDQYLQKFYYWLKNNILSHQDKYVFDIVKEFLENNTFLDKKLFIGKGERLFLDLETWASSDRKINELVRLYIKEVLKRMKNIKNPISGLFNNLGWQFWIEYISDTYENKNKFLTDFYHKESENINELKHLGLIAKYILIETRNINLYRMLLKAKNEDEFIKMLSHNDNSDFSDKILSCLMT